METWPAGAPWAWEMVWPQERAVRCLLKKLKLESLQGPTVPPQDLHPKELKAGSPTDPRAPTFTAALSVTAET